MTLIFQEKELKGFLNSELKSLHIELQTESLNLASILHLHKLNSWLKEHIEIHSVLLTAPSSSKGLDWEWSELKPRSPQEVHEIFMALRNLSASFMDLPQTVIFDLGEKASGAWLELSLGADIRLIKEGSYIQFDHLKKGIVPAAGALSFLGQLVGHSLAKNWILSSLPIESEALLKTGFIQESYQDCNLAQLKVLESISQQSPVARIQTKGAFKEMLKEELNQAQEFETSFARASFETKDFQRFLEHKDPACFTSAPSWRKEMLKPNEETKL